MRTRRVRRKERKFGPLHRRRLQRTVRCSDRLRGSTKSRPPPRKEPPMNLVGPELPTIPIAAAEPADAPLVP